MKDFPQIQISEVIENDDGTSTLKMNVSDEFKDWFKKEQNLKRWSEKRFTKWFTESLKKELTEEDIPDQQHKVCSDGGIWYTQGT